MEKIPIVITQEQIRSKHQQPQKENTAMMHAHIAVGMAAKRIAPRVSLGTLIFAGIFADLLLSVLLLAGVEHLRIAPGFTAVVPMDLYDYPYSHGLLHSMVWSILLGVGYFAWKRDARGSIVVALVAASHWVFDFISHIPDLPLAPGYGARYGLGLWEHYAATHIVEGALFIGGFALYLKTTRPLDRIGRYALAGLFTALCVMMMGSLAGSVPPSATVMAFTTLLQLLLVALAAWGDRHREMRVPA